MTDLLFQVSTLIGTEKELKVGLELNEKAFVLQVVVLIDDKKSAEEFVQLMNDMDKDNCRYGYLCRATRVRLVEDSPLTLSLSGSERTLAKVDFFVILLFAVIFQWLF